MLPKIDGYAVCELIWKQSDIPIIMITALSDEENQIKGLDLMADAYITKPFSMPVLLRKIGAVHRRSQGNQKGEKNRMLVYQNLRLDLDNYQVFAAGEMIPLTKQEFEILKMLLENQGKVMIGELLLEQFSNQHSITVTLKNAKEEEVSTERADGERVFAESDAVAVAPAPILEEYHISMKEPKAVYEFQYKGSPEKYTLSIDGISQAAAPLQQP